MGGSVMGRAAAGARGRRVRAQPRGRRRVVGRRAANATRPTSMATAAAAPAPPSEARCREVAVGAGRRRCQSRQRRRRTGRGTWVPGATTATRHRRPAGCGRSRRRPRRGWGRARGGARRRPRRGRRRACGRARCRRRQGPRCQLARRSRLAGCCGPGSCCPLRRAAGSACATARPRPGPRHRARRRWPCPSTPTGPGAHPRRAGRRSRST